MYNMESLKRKLSKELDEFSEKHEIDSMQALDAVYKLSCTLKNIMDIEHKSSSPSMTTNDGWTKKDEPVKTMHTNASL